MRQFSNICIGKSKKDKEDQDLYFLGIRKIMWAALSPYSSKTIQEKDLIPLAFDFLSNDTIDLDSEIVAVEKDREYWAKVDRLRKERFKNGSSTN